MSLTKFPDYRRVIFRDSESCPGWSRAFQSPTNGQIEPLTLSRSAAGVFEINSDGISPTMFASEKWAYRCLR